MATRVHNCKFFKNNNNKDCELSGRFSEVIIMDDKASAIAKYYVVLCWLEILIGS